MRRIDSRKSRLNPFFIRSAVGNHHRHRNEHLRPVLIPSSSGLLLEMAQTRQGAGQDVLIPSSSGLLLENKDGTDNTKLAGLNPFFIRSAVGNAVITAKNVSCRVLIPSSSGLLLETDGTPTREDRTVLIPSSSGLLLEITEIDQWSHRVGS